MSFLKKVYEKKRKEIAGLKADLNPDSAFLSRPGGKRSFEMLQEVARKRGFFVIAEIKRASPSKGLINPELQAGQRALLYQKNGASAISVLTDEDWFCGSLDDLKEVASTVSIPVLMKDFVVDPVQLEIAAFSGASMVLLILKLINGDLNSYLRHCKKLNLLPLVETGSEQEFKDALESDCRLIGVNARNLETLEVDRGRFYRMARLVRKASEKGALVVAESGFSKREEVREIIELGYHGVLIGTRLSQPGGAAFLKELTGANK